MIKNSKNKKILFFAIFIWILAILFFFYEYFLRVFLGTIASSIILDLKLTAEQFSIICAAYYVIYAIMQPPVGFLVDRFGVRVLLSIAAFVCSLGVFWFGFSHSFFSAVISRMLIGFGASFAFISMLVIALNWFDKKYFAFLSGFAQLLGAVGPLLAGAPLAILLNIMKGNWRAIEFFLGIYGIIVGLLIAIFVRNKPKGKETQLIYLDYKSSFFEKIKTIFQRTQNIWIVLYASLVYVSTPLLAAYWGTSFLQSKGLEKSTAAFVISILWIGYAFGCPIIGKLSDKINKRKPFLILCSILGILSTIFLLFSNIFNIIFLSFSCLVLGFASSGSSLTFAVITENTIKKVHGTALGINNGTIMMLSAFIPSFASSIIQYSLKSHNRSFAQIEHIDFVSGLSIMPIVFSISLIIAIFLIKETFCRSQVEVLEVKKE